MMRKLLVAFSLLCVLAAAGCSSLERKSVAMGGTVNALKIETSGSSSTGTPTPNILMGGATFAFADSPDTDRRPVFVRAARSSFFNSIFGGGMDDSATIYIGTPDETADETVARMQSFHLLDSGR